MPFCHLTFFYYVATKSGYVGFSPAVNKSPETAGNQHDVVTVKLTSKQCDILLRSTEQATRLLPLLYLLGADSMEIDFISVFILICGSSPP